MLWIGWIAVGLALGFMAGDVIKSAEPARGRDMGLGLVGAVAGGTLFHALDWGGRIDFDFSSLVVAALGAAMALVARYALTGWA